MFNRLGRNMNSKVDTNIYLLLIVFLAVIVCYLQPKFIIPAVIIVGVTYYFTLRSRINKEVFFSSYMDNIIRNIERTNHFAVRKLDIGIAVFSKNGKLQWKNSLFQEWVGKKHPEGMKPEELLPLGPNAFELMSVRDGEKVIQIEDRFYRMKYCGVQTQETPSLRTSEQGSSGLMIYLTDITDFELLLVDDGSPDNSGEVADALAKTDARIRVFHKENGGPASASNMGLDNARGDYIGFVDSDDLIAPDMYEKLYAAVQAPGVRLAACAGDCIDEDGNKIEGRVVTSDLRGVHDAQELLLDAFKTGSFYGPLSWNKLFDARLFKDKGIHYDETMLFGDDASVLHRVFEGEKCNCLGDTLYHYRTRAGQITTAGFPPRKLDDLRMYWDWLQYFAAKPDRTEYQQWATACYWRLFYQFWCQSGAAGNLNDLKDQFMAHKKHLDAVVPDLMRSPLLSAGEKVRLVLFSANPSAFYGAATAWGRLTAKRKGK